MLKVGLRTAPPGNFGTFFDEYLYDGQAYAPARTRNNGGFDIRGVASKIYGLRCTRTLIL